MKKHMDMEWLKDAREEACGKPESIVKKEGQFYFHDEAQELHGLYATMAEVHTAMMIYCKTLYDLIFE
jgi:hypothetical protein